MAQSTSLQNTTNLLEQTTQAIFNFRSIIVLILAVSLGVIVGRIVTRIISGLSSSVGKKADKAADLGSVKRLRRVETLLVLSTAMFRLLFVTLGLIAWWAFTHPAEKPTALIGAGALIALLLNGAFSPILRDVAFGGGMMAEQWFGVGDMINVVPFNTLGVVERITLRSTRLRELSGDVVWITNQNIAGAEVILQGARAIALEIFVSDQDKADGLIEDTNALLPEGSSLLVSPLAIISIDEVKPDIWHVVVIGETAPGREEIIRENAVKVLADIDKKHYNILLSKPIDRYADNKAERQFGRAINNARKTRNKTRRRLQLSHLDRRDKKKEEPKES
jgi:small-conductance mechanosensitive channel